MRQAIREIATMVANTFQIREPIYEFGALQVLGDSDLEDLRPIFPGKEYIGTDMRDGPGVDKVLNLHSIDLPDETVGTALVFETMEHVEYPRQALAELHRVVQPGGILVMSSLMNFPIHDHPHDYWRYTPEAFRSLLKLFESSFVGCAGEDDFPHTVIGIGLKSAEKPSEEFIRLYDEWRRRWFFLHGRSWRQIRRHLTPPILRKGFRWRNG